MKKQWGEQDYRLQSWRKIYILLIWDRLSCSKGSLYVLGHEKFGGTPHIFYPLLHMILFQPLPLHQSQLCIELEVGGQHTHHRQLLKFIDRSPKTFVIFQMKTKLLKGVKRYSWKSRHTCMKRLKMDSIWYYKLCWYRDWLWVHICWSINISLKSHVIWRMNIC